MSHFLKQQKNPAKSAYLTSIIRRITESSTYISGKKRCLTVHVKISIENGLNILAADLNQF